MSAEPVAILKGLTQSRRGHDCAVDLQPLVAVVTGSDPALGYLWHTLENPSVVLSGTQNFTPDTTTLDRQKLVCRISLASGAVVETAPVPVVNQPPRQVASLPDQVLEGGAGGDMLSISYAFEGKGLRFLLLDGPGEIDSRDGTLILEQRGRETCCEVHIAAENSGGRIESRFWVTFEAPEGQIVQHDPAPHLQLASAAALDRAKSDSGLPEVIISTDQQLQAFLDSNQAAKARLKPGLYETPLMITGRPPQGVRVVEAFDPENRPEIRHVIYAKGDVAERGFVTFRNVLFRNPDLRAYRAIMLGPGTKITVEDCEFTGDMGYAYQGFNWQPEQNGKGKALYGRQFIDLVFRRNLVRNLAHGVHVAGRNILIEQCLFDSLYTDPITLVAALEGHTQDVQILDNEARNPAGDPSILHYDFVQSFPEGGSRKKRGLRRIRIAGNVLYWGPKGLRYPGNGNTAFAQAVLTYSQTIERAPEGKERHLYLVDASGGPCEITLPAPNFAAHEIANFTLRKIDDSANPVRVKGAGLLQDVAIEKQGNTTTFTRKGLGWSAKQAAPYIQGIFVQDWDPAEGVSGMVICGNIFVGAASWAMGVGIRGASAKGGAFMRHVHIMNNTCLPQWPGDGDGDGTINEANDGYHSFGSSIRSWAPAMRIERNIANSVAQSPLYGRKAKPLPVNDTFPRDDYGQLALRFPAPGGQVFAPMSRQEAVELATPLPRGRVPKGFGATAVWDFDRGEPLFSAPILRPVDDLTLEITTEGWITPISVARFADGADVSFFAEDLPPGLWLKGEGIFFGRPTKTGTWTIEITACNAAGFSEPQKANVTVKRA